MFRTVSLSIIRSFSLYTQQWYMSYRFTDCSLASSQLCVQWKTPDDGQRNCLEHVEFYSKNKFEKLVHLIGFIIRIDHDWYKCNPANINVIIIVIILTAVTPIWKWIRRMTIILSSSGFVLCLYVNGTFSHFQHNSKTVTSLAIAVFCSILIFSLGLTVVLRAGLISACNWSSSGSFAHTECFYGFNRRAASSEIFKSFFF